MVSEIGQKTSLLDSINKAATILLLSKNEEFENNLMLCMGMIGRAVDADRLCIWKNSVKNGKLHCTLEYEWVVHEKLRTPADISTEVPYEGNIPTLEKLLTQGECVNTLTSDMTSVEQKRFALHGIKSVFVAPVFVDDEFWGFVGCDDCHEESIFSDDVVTTLRSGSLLIANALLRNEMTLNMQKAAVELEKALMDTQKANNAKSDFLASMSHEMRTPLNAIIGLSGLCLENSDLETDIRVNIEKVYSSGDMLLSIVNDILDISKIEAGRMELVELDYDVPSLINDTVTQNILRIGEKPIDFMLDVGVDSFARLNGDELRVKQIMNNLLSNAIKYTDEGVVELSVHCRQDGDVVWVTIKVSDTGRGIKPDDLSKLFNDYSQLDVHSNRKTEGTGLGLPILKSFTEMMNGTVEVQSEYGKGSVFTVKIAQNFVTDVHIGPEVVENLKNFRYSDEKRGYVAHLERINIPYARVLVVDDNITNLDVAKGLMSTYGMKIDCVTSGQQATDAIRNEKVQYNAVFMDHMMPGMDGIEATRIIREEIGSDYAKNIPIIALTANAIAGNEQMFLSKGFNAFIPKPIELGRLDKVIKRFLRDKTKENELIAQQGDNAVPGLKFFENAKIPGINIKSGLECFGGKEEMYLSVLRSYAAHTLPLLEKIKSVTKENLPDYAIIIHGVKGSSRGISAIQAGNLAEQLEKAANAGNYDYVSENNEQAIKLITELVENIRGLLGKIDEANPKPTKDRIEKKLLTKLFEACDSFDMDGADETMTEIMGYQYETDGDLSVWLSENIQQTNFNEITKKLALLI